MAKIKLPHFGQLDSDHLEDYYDVVIDYNNRELQIDLNFESSLIDAAKLEIARKFIEQFADFDFRNKKYIEADFKNPNGEAVETYIIHHLENLDQDDLDELVDFSNKRIPKEEQLMAKLHLVRLGIYPDSNDQFAVFDYSIGAEITQYILALVIDEFGNLNFISMES